jgi:hypothetical protein
MKNSALQNLLNLANESGAIKSTETTKSNIYKECYFDGVTDEKEEKKIRRTLRNIAINFLSLLANAKDKKEFDANYNKFAKFFAETYTEEKVNFSVFDTLRKDSAKKVLQGAITNFEKYNK